MRNILVTGGAGYIGSHTCLALSQRGFTPVVLDNLVNGHREFVNWGPLETGDICDKERLEAVIRKYQPAAIIHFAGLIEVSQSFRDPAAFFEINVGGSITLFATALKAGVDKIVFSSTCATYGIPKGQLREDHPQSPVSPYGRSKLITEQVLDDLSANTLRIPTKPAMHSNSKPAGDSDLKPATRGVVRIGQFHDVVEGWEGQETD